MRLESEPAEAALCSASAAFLLGHLVEMGDSLAHLVDAVGLLARRRRDVGDGGGDLLRGGEDLTKLLARLTDELHALADLAVGGRISAEMSLAASLERCASVRTSEATTANPLPASPARAASTAALSASRLVWKAISSITRMMSRSWSRRPRCGPWHRPPGQLWCRRSGRLPSLRSRSLRPGARPGPRLSPRLRALRWSRRSLPGSRPAPRCAWRDHPRHIDLAGGEPDISRGQLYGLDCLGQTLNGPIDAAFEGAEHTTIIALETV